MQTDFKNKAPLYSATFLTVVAIGMALTLDPVDQPQQSEQALLQSLAAEGLTESEQQAVLLQEQSKQPDIPATAALLDPDVGGTWSSVIDWPHVPVHMASLPNGKIMSWSGGERAAWGNTEQTYSAVWDPKTNRFDEHFSLGHNMFCAGISLTSEGEVFVVGGRFQANSTESSLYDWRENSWQQMENMSGGRWYPSTLALPNGDIYTASGTGNVSTTSERWQRDSGWQLQNGLDWSQMARYPYQDRPNAWQSGWPTVYLAPSGQLFHGGPTPDLHWIDPTAQGQATDAGKLGFEYFGSSASTMYRPGKMLSSGGRQRPTGKLAVDTAWTIDINGASPIIAATGSMKKTRAFHNFVILPNGEVASIGGNETGTPFNDRLSSLAAEIWNPETGQWRLAAEMSVPRNYHSTALLLADGRVVSAGGGYPAGNHPDGQVWTPPYLYDASGSPAVRPTISSAPALIHPGDSFAVHSPDSITEFNLIRLGTATHQQNTDQRFVPLDFDNLGSGNYQLRTTNNANVLLPGYWMLFALNAQGVPSEAHILKVSAEDAGRISNLATQGRASQISTYSSALAPSFAADLAIDGNTSGKATISLAHTKSALNPWWDVELGSLTRIENIRLWNRERNGVPDTRMRNLKVFVSDKAFSSNDPTVLANSAGVWSGTIDGVLARPSELSVGVEGRFVRVQHAGNGFLNLAEIQVFATDDQRISHAATVRDLTVSDSDWQKFTFEKPFEEPPIVVMGPATNNFIDPVMARIRDTGTDGFEFKLAEWDYQSGTHGYEQLSLLALPNGRQNLGGLDAHAGNIRVGTGWQTVHFDIPFADTPALFVQLASNYETESVSVRVRQVSANSFAIRIADEDNGDTRHGTELINYIAVTPGTGSFDGKPIKVGITAAVHNHNWRALNFGDEFQNPHLIASIQTTKSIESVVLRQRKLSNDSVELLVQEEKSKDSEVAHANESIAWMVIGDTPELQVEPISSIANASGSPSIFNAQAVGVGLQYNWQFGDGSSSGYSRSPSATHNYSTPGHYTVVLMVRDNQGNEETQSFNQVIHAPISNARAKSSGMLITHNGKLWNVNPDNNSVTVSTSAGVATEIEVGQQPQALAVTPGGGQVWVSNKADASISIIDSGTLQLLHTLPLPRGSQPHGIVFSQQHAKAWVALEATGEIATFNYHSRELMARTAVGQRPRHLALTAAQDKLLVSRFITATVSGESSNSPNVSDGGGEIWQLDPGNMSLQRTFSLLFSDAEVSEHSGPGIPNYLGAAVISNDDSFAWIPSKQDAILGGQNRSGPDLRFDQTVRAISSRINLDTGQEDLSARIDHDNSGVASAAAFDRSGAWLFVALESSREVGIHNAYTGVEVSRINTAQAPQALATSDDGKSLYVYSLSERRLQHFDISRLTKYGETTELKQVASLKTVSQEALSAKILKGKMLFYDAADTRLATHAYLSCASCHNDGDHDGRVWDFSQFGEGLRSTTSLRGKGNPAHGRLHWTGNFDEIHDFEGQIRDLNAGSGLMSSADFNASRDPLGSTKAGRSADLDALAAYVNSLQLPPDSPYAGDTLSAAAQSGKARFDANNCASCHSGTALTDSATGQRHNVGTIKASSGKRIGGTLDGFDTPSLLDLHATAPYLHDGSAATVADAIRAHSSLSVSVSDADAIAAYLRELPSIGVSVEVDGLQNLAPRGTAIQSSTGYGGIASKANDNNTASIYSQSSVTHTARQAQPWWQVDLGSNADLRKIVLFNRSDCCSNRLRNFTVFASDTNMGGKTLAQLQSDAQIWKHYHAGVAAAVTTIALQQTARYVRVQLSDTNYLSLAEVQVWVEKPSGSVNTTPTLSQPVDMHSVVGTATQLQLVASDTDGDTMQYSAIGLPVGLRINASTGLISGTPSTAGNTAITVRVTDNKVSAERSFSWRVDAPASPRNALTSGQSVSAQLASGQWAYYTIDSNSDHTTLLASLSDLSADLDLYVRKGSKPSGHSEDGGVYDCHSIRGSTSNESCALSNDGAGRWHIAVYAYQSGSFTLRTDLGKQANTGSVLSSAQPVQGLLEERQWQHFTFDTAAAATAVSVDLSNLSADADLYVRLGAKPSLDSYDCRSDLGSTAAENCQMDNTAASTWHIGVYGYEASVFTLTASDGSAVATRAAKPHGLSKSSNDAEVVYASGGALGWAWLTLAVMLANSRRRSNVKTGNTT